MKVDVTEPEITLASTTESQEELDHAAGENWREHFQAPEKKPEPKATPEAPSPDAKTTPAVPEAASAGTKEEGKSQAETPGAKTEEEDDEKPLPKGVQKRIDKLHARLKATEDELAKVKGAAKPAEPAKPATNEDSEPQEKDFKTYGEWIRAHNKWAAREAIREHDKKLDQEDIQAQLKENFDNHITRVNEARAKYDDFDEAVNAIKTPFAKEVQPAIIELPNSADVIYHLAKHPEEAEEISQLSPLRQIAELGRISASLLPSKSAPAPVVKPVSKAPEPVKPVSSSAPVARPLNDPELSTDEFIRRRNQAERERRRR